MTSKIILITGVVAAVVITAVIWWRNRPINRAERLLTKAAETASVSGDDGDIMRRLKMGKLRDYIGYELSFNVEGIASESGLMQDDALSAWLYVIGRDRYLTIEIMDVELVSAEDEKIVVNARVSVASDYRNGRYSKVYPVVIELMKVERSLRVISLKTKAAFSRNQHVSP